MLPSSNMRFVLLFLISMHSLHEGEATNMMKKNQVFGPLQPQVPPNSLPVPDSPKTGDTWFGKKALANDFALLRREFLGYSQPSTPNPDTYIPASISTSTNHKAAPAPSLEFPVLRRKLLKGHTRPSAPNPATYIPPSTSSSTYHKAAPAPPSTSSSTNHKAAPAPSSEFPVLRRKLLKGHTRPSAPNPATYIPPSTGSSTHHKAAPAPPSTSSSTNHKAAPAPSPEFPVLGRKLLKGHTRPSAPNPATYIPPSTSSIANHKATPAPSPGTVL